MKSKIKLALVEILKSWKIESENFTVEHPTILSHGDYATNIALVVAKEMKLSPRQVAEKIKESLEGKIKGISKIEIAGPGFINFFLETKFLANSLEKIVSAGEAWGRNESEKGEEILVEYTSPNLFKPLHIGNLVGNFTGETLARLFDFSGAKVFRINYPSDIGPVVAKSVWGLRELKLSAEEITNLGQAYVFGTKAYDENEVAKKEIDEINQVLYRGDNKELNLLRKTGIETSIKHLRKICKILDTKFDFEFFESEVGDLGKEIVLKNMGSVFEKSQGAIVFKGEKIGLHTRVFLNSKNLPTYEAKDLGNMQTKLNKYPNWTRSIIVTGNEQKEYFVVLFVVLKAVFSLKEEQKLEHISTGFLTLTTGKMSSRKGNVLTGEDLLNEVIEASREKAKKTRAKNLEEMTEMVAVAALKFQILRQSLGSNIIFDKEKALSFEGDSGPYLQYTHARTVSILEKAETLGLTKKEIIPPVDVKDIEKLLYRFQEVVEEATAERAPQKIISYLTEVASSFNTFYGQEKIIDENDPHSSYRLLITKATRITLKNGLWLLGIKAPEQM